MNAQHKICKALNRKRRIERRLKELEADKTKELVAAKTHNREPRLADIYITAARLTSRLQELTVG